MGFIFFIIIFFIILGIVILLIILGVVRNILGLGRKKAPFKGENNTTSHQSTFNSRKQQQKVFGDKEGEYVDYEEIKDQ